MWWAFTPSRTGPKNRGMKLTASPVKILAQAHNIPVFQPENFREDADVEALRALQPDVVAVVAYGRILPQRVLDIPAKGCINIHASLLPEYRGSAPYQWAVLEGRQETGVTAMYLVREMDAGDMIDQGPDPHRSGGDRRGTAGPAGGAGCRPAVRDSAENRSRDRDGHPSGPGQSHLCTHAGQVHVSH